MDSGPALRPAIAGRNTSRNDKRWVKSHRIIFGAPLHQTNAPRRRADDPVALMRLILRRVRQRTFVIFNPYVIPRIDPAIARLAPEKMFDFPNPTPVDALAEQRPARSRFIE